MQKFYLKFILILILSCICVISSYLYQNIAISKKEKHNKKNDSTKQVWALYYAHWGNFETNGKWINWKIPLPEAPYLSFEPPNTIPSLYFPLLGLYSSEDKSIIKTHFKTLNEAGLDALIIPWDHQSDIVSSFMKKAQVYLKQYELKIGILIPDHLDNITIIKNDIVDFVTNYPENMLKIGGKTVVIFKNPKISNVAELIHSFHDSLNDCIFLATGINQDDHMIAFENGFDGFITYYPNQIVSYYGNYSNWDLVAHQILERNFIFVPTVSPGVNETAISIQYSYKSQSRQNGKYYAKMWEHAISINSDIVMINSFNNWYDGTVIEPISLNPKFPLNSNIWAGSDSYYFIKETAKYISKFKNVFD